MAQDQKWYMNEDGTLKCFGKAYEYSNYGQSFHCGQLHYIGDCNEALRRECWKRSPSYDGYPDKGYGPFGCRISKVWNFPLQTLRTIGRLLNKKADRIPF